MPHWHLVDISHDLGRSVPDWPKLLHLYSRMRLGKMIFEWMQDQDVHSLGIDVRRFASFGATKVRIFLHRVEKRDNGRVSHPVQGLLHCVHRWPVPLTDEVQQPPESKPTTLPPSPISRKRVSSLTTASHPTSVCPRWRTSGPAPAFAAVSARSTSGTISPPSRAAKASSLIMLHLWVVPSSPQTVHVRKPRRLFDDHASISVRNRAVADRAHRASSASRAPQVSHSPSSPAIKTQANGAAPAPHLY